MSVQTAWKLNKMFNIENCRLYWDADNAYKLVALPSADK